VVLKVSYFIETKLIPPQVSREIPRKRLIQKANDPVASRLILISAAGGYGKTSLASSLVQARGLPCLWYQLDKEDINLDVFIGYLSRGWYRLGGKQFNLPVNSETVVVSPEEKIKIFLAFFTEEVCNQTQQLLVVLDDYHLVSQSESVNKLVQQLINYLPSNVQLIMTSRMPFPFPLGSLRTRGWLTEITGDELAFTQEEAKELLQEFSLSQEEIAELWSKVEGWAAGLSLVRYVMLQGIPKEDFLTRITDYTGEYLEQEMITALSPEQYSFLETTSLLEYPDQEACRALTGDQEAGKHLKELSKKHFFVMSTPGGVYRYHQLLRDYLIKRLKAKLTREEWLNLHRCAGNIYYQQGRYLLAINHYFQANELESITEPLLKIAPETLEKGKHAQLKKWLDMIPQEKMDMVPRLQYYRAKLLALAGRKEDALILIDNCRALSKEAGDQVTEALILILQGNLAIENYYGEAGEKYCHEAIELLQTMTDIPRQEKDSLWAEAYSVLARALLLQEKWNEAMIASEKAAELFQNVGQLFGKIHNLSQDYYLFIYHPRQDLRQALRAFQAAEEMWERAGNDYEKLMARVNKAIIYRIMGQVRKAEEILCLVLEQTEDGHLVKTQSMARFALAQARRDQGCLEEALELFQDVIFQARRFQWKVLEAGSLHCLSSLYLQKENQDASRYYGEKALEHAKHTKVDYFEGQALMNMGMLERNQDNLLKALEYLQEALGIFERWDSKYELTRVYFYLAEVYFQQHVKKKNSQNNRQETNGNINWEEEVVLLVSKGMQLIETNDFNFFWEKEKNYLRPLLNWVYEKTGSQERPVQELLKKLINPLDHKKEEKEPVLEVKTLGSLKVYRQGKLISSNEWKNLKVLGLFRYLSTYRYHKVERDVLLETFWPEREPAAASHNFSSCLYILRRVLEPGLKKGAKSHLVKYEKGLCWLNCEAIRWDADAFLDAVEKARDTANKGKYKDAIEAYHKAWDIYQGDYLEEYLYDDWLIGERERLRELWLQSCRELAEILEIEKDYQEAVRVLKHAIRKEPYQEELYRRLINNLLLNGRKDEAIKEYRACYKMLEVEFGIEPAEETRKLLKN